MSFGLLLLNSLLPVAFGGAFLAYFAGKVSSRLRNFLAVLTSLLLIVIIGYLYPYAGGEVLRQPLSISFMGVPLILRLNMLSWFFAITIVGIGLLSIIYSLEYMKDGERLDYYYFSMLFVNAAMLGTVVAGDLISFYIFWEVVSWSTYLLISHKGGKAVAAGLKYIIMSIIGSLAMLVAIISLYVTYGTLEIPALAAFMGAASLSYILFILGMLSVTFVIINALWPVHTWLPDAHAESVSPFSSVLSAVLVRKGIYGLCLFIYFVFTLDLLRRFPVAIEGFSLFLCVIGAITIVFAALSALLKNDSKRILAWSTVEQGGYMFLGIAFGTAVGLAGGMLGAIAMAGGMLHFFNNCICKALLFFVAGAVEYRTAGTRDINALGGLIKKMPITFIGGVLGIAGLAGLPLTNGFVSKWLIYKALILGNHPFLAFAAFLGTWGTILYGYKFIHNIFLGQLPEKYKDVKEVPFSMQLPIVLLSIGVILFGVLPGIPLRVINAIGISFGLKSLNVSTWGIASDTGTLNTINIFFAVLVIGLVVWMITKVSQKKVGATRVAQHDSYTAGTYVPTDKYHYTVDFYSPLSIMIRGYARDFADEFYYWIVEKGRTVCDTVRRIYTGDVRNYVAYIVCLLAFLLFVQMVWNPW